MPRLSRRDFIGGSLALGGALTAGATTASSWTPLIKRSSQSGAASANLRYSLWDPNQQPTQQQIVNKFQETHPHVKITIENTPFTDYWTKLQTEGSAKNMPDVMWMNLSNFLDYAEAGLVVPLNSYIKKSNIKLKNYPKVLVDMYTLNGKHYGLNKDFDTIGLWYNKKIFDQNGVKYPDATWDWTTVHQVAKKLTNKSQGYWGIGADLADQEGFFNTVYQNDGYVWNGKNSGIGKPAAVEGLTFWTDFIKAGSSPNVGQLTESDQNHDMFMSGKLAMCYAGDWNTIAFAQSPVKDQIDVTVLPKGKKRAVVIHGLAYMIAQNSQHKKEAWEFISYAASREAAQIQAGTGSVLPAYNGSTQPWVKKYPQYHAQIYLDELAYAVEIPIRTKHAEQWATAETKILTPAWQGKVPMSKAAKQWASTIDKDASGALTS